MSESPPLPPKDTKYEPEGALAREAQRLVSLGYHVFQCLPKSKDPFAGANGTAPHGCKSATDDLETVRKWWSDHPECNIGIRCDNILVLDVDNKNGKSGTKDLRRVAQRLGELPEGPYSKSGNCGFHKFFRRPEGDFVASKGILWEGEKLAIDVQIGNQYIVAPPSIHPETGRPYRWGLPLVSVTELPSLPKSWITSFLQRRKTPANIVPQSKPIRPIERSGPSLLRRCRLYLDKIPPCIAGQGGDTQLFKAACTIFWDFGFSESEGMPLLQEYNARCLPPWPEYRLGYKMTEALKPEVHDRPQGHLAEQSRVEKYNVDLSAFKSQLKVHDGLESPSPEPEEVDEEEPVLAAPFRQAIPNELLCVPGFVNEFKDFCLAHSPHPVPAMAFSAGLALQSFLCGRKVTEKSGLRTNLYLLALAGSGVGKDYARQAIKAVVDAIDIKAPILERFTSGAAIETRLLTHPNILLLNDEFDAILASIKKGRDPNTETLLSTLLILYTSARSTYTVRGKADSKVIEKIHQPHLTIYGTATPGNYYSALNRQMLEGGLFARMMILDAGSRPRGQDSLPAEEILRCERIMEAASWWYEFEPQEPGLGTLRPNPIVVPCEEQAQSRIRQYRIATDDEYERAETRGDEVAMSVWSRAEENTIKLALLAACSEDYKAPVIRLRHVHWAIRFNEYLIRRALALANDYVYETEFDAKIKKALLELRKWHAANGLDKPMPEWKLKRKLGLSPMEFESVKFELEQRRQAEFVKLASKGRPACGFRMITKSTDHDDH